MNVGVVFDCTIRNNGTASYCMPALKQLPDTTVKHYFPRGEIGKHDFYLYVDDGMDHISWLPPKPNAYWAIDTHLGYGYRLWKARQFDRTFVAQKDAVARMKKDGVKNVEWLPLACCPEAHLNRKEFIRLQLGQDSKLDLTEQWDWGFVGYMQDNRGEGYNNRIDYLDALQKAIPNGRIAVNRFFEAMALVYVKSLLGFNISIKQDLNMRVFEVLSTGCPLLTNRNVHGIGDLFIDGVEYLGYEGPAEMVEVAKVALNDESFRRTIGENGFNKVRASHTYRHRMETICEVMKHA